MNSKRYTFNYLRNIEIEISSLCNRHCDYCPVSKIKRSRELFPFDIFKKIMNELAEINYCGSIAFHQYNEPLLEYDYLCRCIICAKELNPYSRIELYTNGDLLTRKRYKELKKLGVNRLVITCQTLMGKDWNVDEACESIKKLMKKIGVRGSIKREQFAVSRKESDLVNHIYKLKEFGYDKIKKYPFKLQIRSINYMASGSNRVETVSEVNTNRIKNNELTYYCYSLMHGIHISYKGNMYMCCDCCEDIEGSELYIVGSVLEEKVYDLFAKKNKLVQKYMDEDKQMRICKNCYWNQ